MFSAIVFVLVFSAASASPLLVGSDDWNTWFSPQSDAVDTQIPSQLDSVNLENDMYLSDLSSYGVNSGDNLFGSTDESVISEPGDPGTNLAYTGDWADDGPIAEDRIFGPEAQATTDLESYAVQDGLPDPAGPLDSLNLVAFDWIPKIENPTAKNPCPLLETRCCQRIQYAPLFYVEKEHCGPCANALAKLMLFRWRSPADQSHRRRKPRSHVPKMQKGVNILLSVGMFFVLFFSQRFSSSPPGTTQEKGN